MLNGEYCDISHLVGKKSLHVDIRQAVILTILWKSLVKTTFRSESDTPLHFSLE